MFMILECDDNALTIYADLVKKYQKASQVIVTFDHLRQRRHLCSDFGCFGKNVKIAIKRRLLQGITWSEFKRHYCAYI